MTRSASEIFQEVLERSNGSTDPTNQILRDMAVGMKQMALQIEDIKRTLDSWKFNGGIK